jgi:hypothetical protein
VRESSPRGLGFGRRRRAPALKSDGGDDAVAPGGDGEVDEERLDAGKTMASSTCSIGSWCDGEGRLEETWRR